MNGRTRLSLLALAILLQGCSLPEPYVYREHEFDRTLKTFNKPLPDLTEVVICYNKRNSTPETVRKLAQDACGEYGKRAEFVDHQLFECPLLVPAAARFSCLR